ncbi:MAG: bifunctional metallophosphatase/5'-nucleotidase [Deltaproteobacteria bacterium]
MDIKTNLKVFSIFFIAITLTLNLSSTNNISKIKKLVILHTNDWHSRIEPFPDDGSRNSNLGGAARRGEIIEKIRSEEKNILLFDAGDIFQGTPYFNYFGGEPEFKIMSEMGYNAATLGNHDFDGGMEGLLKAMQFARFDFIASNYDFDNTILKNKTKQYRIFEIDGLKIGVFSANIELEGLVPEKLYKETKYLDPVTTSQKISEYLKIKEKCHFVVCLSHLGYKYKDDKISDVKLAEQSEFIDLILGGHTHTFMNEGEKIKNKRGQDVLISQAGWGGILLGKIEILFDSKNKCLGSKSTYLK